MSGWRKSSRSGTQDDTACVEVAALDDRVARVVGVRDSKDPDGPRLVLSRAAWDGLLGRLKGRA